MVICLTSSLKHLACVKIVTLLLNNSNVDLRRNTGKAKHYRIILKIKHKISKLLPCICYLQVKLENFITPILREAENWTEYCAQNWIVYHSIPLRGDVKIPLCWLSNGTIDRLKSAQILVKRNDLNPINRFVFACIFCMFHDVLDLWNILSKIEKNLLQHKYFAEINKSSVLVKQWIEWLDSSIKQDWESFVAWTFQTALWKTNVYIMKRVLETSNPLVRNHYLLEAFHEREVSNDVKRFGLTIMSREDQEVILRESPVEVFKCILSWPLRSNFIDIVDNLWPYITTDVFCSILDAILSRIKNEESDYIDLLVILKNFWTQSPGHCKEAAEKDSAISRPLNFVLEHDFSKQFSIRRFVNSFKPEYNPSAVYRIPPFADFLMNVSDEDYI